MRPDGVAGGFVSVGAKHTRAVGCFARTRSVICVGAILVIARIRLTWITKANTRFAPTAGHGDTTDAGWMGHGMPCPYSFITYAPFSART